MADVVNDPTDMQVRNGIVGGLLAILNLPLTAIVTIVDASSQMGQDNFVGTLKQPVETIKQVYEKSLISQYERYALLAGIIAVLAYWRLRK